MKTKITFAVLCLSALVSLQGCKGAPSAMVYAADRFVNNDVGPEYEKYVADDAALTPEQKEIRLINVQSFRQAVQAAKGAPK